ncbi:MAG: hypothetical protein V1779_16905 [bacterium]
MKLNKRFMISLKGIVKNKKIITAFFFTYLLCCFFVTGSSIKLLAIDKVEYFKNKFGNKCANEKITDNFGNGYDSLYGTRNLRTILHGIAYRGGANNFYHKNHKRDNHNPLPEDGLKNLSNQGFSSAVYLYGTNFSIAQKFAISESTNDTLNYFQIGGNNKKELRRIMLMVKDVINNPEKGPIYFHCWNGWHQSGYISAAILMQFCRLTNGQAYQYWLDNTDGVNKGYENVKKLVKNFVPFEDITIDNSIKEKICPCIKSK